MTKYRLVRAEPDNLPTLDGFEDRTICQTPAWLRFVAHSQHARPVVAAVQRDGQTIGRFTGLLFSRCGLSFLGSPFPGWSTSYMGFNLPEGSSRVDALAALERFAFQDLKCVHFELMDRGMALAEVRDRQLTHRVYFGFEVDLTGSEDELLKAMKPPCRRCIRKAEKLGVQVEEAGDTDAFVDEYYAQLQDVFIKQGLTPTYKIDRVRSLVTHLQGTGHLLLARARSKEGESIATGVFPAFHDTMYFWGGASWRPSQHLRPNEALQWFAMRYWKQRGIKKYDMGGGGEYKRKYGGREIAVPWIRRSKYPIVEAMRNQVRMLYSVRQRLLALWRARRQPGEKVVDESDDS
jgi:hypothetical protein